MAKNKKVRKKHRAARYAAVFFRVFSRLFAVIAVICLIGGAYFGLHFYRKYYRRYDASARETVENGSRKDFRLKEPTYIYDRDGNLLTKLRAGGDSAYLTYDKIPAHAVNAFVAVEDRTFWTNPGYDLKGIARVGWYYVKTHGVEAHGASTITQQLARNSYVTREVTISRKVKEILVAKYLTKKYTKEDIMEFYVNDVYFANQYYGLEAAAQGYFGRSARALSLSQIAYLCAIPNRPAWYDPVRYPDHALKRRDKILDDMLELNYITEDQCRRAKEEVITIKENSGGELHDYQSTYAMDCVVRYFMKQNEFPFQYTFETDAEYRNYQDLYDDAYEEEKNRLYSGGYRIYTTLDSGAQEALQAALDEVLSFDTEINEATGAYALQGSVTAVDNGNGKVVAIVGGRTDPRGKSTTYTLNRAYQSFRQPGSSIKPLIVYAPALEKGYYPGTVLNNIDVTKAKEKGANALMMTGKAVLLRNAVERSLNGCAWQIMANLKPAYCLKHITDMEYRNIVPGDNTLATSLGGFTYGVTSSEQAAGYAALANHGLYRGQTCISAIRSPEGEEIYKDSDPVRVYESSAADTMIDIMKGVIIRGTAASMGWYKEEKTEAAGKTGTTNKSKDGWFCGVTPYYSAAVWVGYDTPRELKDLYGSSYPASIWKKSMQYLISGKSEKTFSLPKLMPEMSAGAEKYLPGREDSELLSEGYTVGDYRKDRATGEMIGAVIAEMSALRRTTDPNFDADIAARYYQCTAALPAVKDPAYAASLQSEINTAYATAATRVD